MVDKCKFKRNIQKHDEITAFVPKRNYLTKRNHMDWQPYLNFLKEQLELTGCTA